MTNFTYPRPVPLRPEQYVYRIFDEEGTCLYVGNTFSLDVRWKAHLTASPWAASAKRCKATGPLDMVAAADLERREIWRLNPIHNGVRYKGLEKFFARWDGPPAKALSELPMAALLGIPYGARNYVGTDAVEILALAGPPDTPWYIVADSEIERLRQLRRSEAAA